MAVRIEPFKRRQSRNVIISAPKYYLFDVGVSGILTKRNLEDTKGEEFGRAFEHFILMEISAYNSYSDSNFDINFWRTKSGLEVDFVLGKGEIAIEVKGSDRIDARDLKSLKAFIEGYSPKKAIVVCNERERRACGKIQIVPWRDFLSDLWSDKIL